tara:strand:+ start:2023 stop:2313 length:291 start_codon:yes stop_codon:yes gene_type:complete
MKQPIESLVEFQLTEKANLLSSEYNQYTFKVAREASKQNIASAIEEVFDVHVTKVNTLNQKPKLKRDRMRKNTKGKKGGYKKAIVTLKEGETIQMI